MKTVFKDPWVDGLLNQGRAEMLLALLERRFGVPAGIRERVAACNDAAQIKAWFERAIGASSLDEVFGELAAGRFADAGGHGAQGSVYVAAEGVVLD